MIRRTPKYGGFEQSRRLSELLQVNNIWLIKNQFAIGNRAELVITDGGCVLWDLIPFLDQESVDKVWPAESSLRKHII